MADLDPAEAQAEPDQAEAPDLPGTAEAPARERPPTRPTGPSEASVALMQRYAALAARQQSRGLLRRDPAPMDAPITPYLLARNFEAIALSTEHGLDMGGAPTAGAETALARWQSPVLVEAIYGPSLSAATRQAAQGEVATTVAQIGRATGHPIRQVSGGGNFKILILSEDDRNALSEDNMARLLPGVPFAVRQALLRPNPNARCLVIGLGSFGQPNTFSAAVALVRAELPAVMRFACIQEEMAQGLGLPNDSVAARPSIFNDDDEFAVLTEHDESLLRILYDARLTPGMRRDVAQPIIREIAAELVDGPEQLASLERAALN